MENNDKSYGVVKDGTLLTDETASVMVEEGFNTLNNGNARIIKAPQKYKRIKASVKALPGELQTAAEWREGSAYQRPSAGR